MKFKIAPKASLRSPLFAAFSRDGSVSWLHKKRADIKQTKQTYEV